MGAASVRTRSASNRSLPAETGVWMVNTDRAPDLLQGLLEGHAGGDQLAGPLHEQERRVALVEVPRGGRDAQRAERPDATDAQHQLLVQAHLAAADVQDVGDRAGRASSLRGVSVSSSSSGTRPTWTSQTATWTVRPGSSTGTVSGSPISSATRWSGRWETSRSGYACSWWPSASMDCRK